MGSGSYSVTNRDVRAKTLNYHTAPITQTFSQRTMHVSMAPEDVRLRESRDSEEHPNSVPIIIALDVTGSMGAVPAHLVKDGLPNIMSSIMDGGITDPQILFLGIGDHETDDAPLQIGQFESSDELLDKWLTTTYLEGGGGANGGESYLLAWFFAGDRTEHDAMDKRGKKGYLFTIGDEPTLKSIPKHTLKTMFGTGQFSDVTADEALKRASEKYNIYHIHTKETWSGSINSTIDGWKQLLHDNVIVVQSHTQIPGIIASIITEGEGKVEEPLNVTIDTNKDVDEIEDML